MHSLKYYNYDESMRTPICGLGILRGEAIKPQFWPRSCNYTIKSIFVVGSGATAIRFLPNLAEDASMSQCFSGAHDTYISTLPMSRLILTSIFLVTS